MPIRENETFGKHFVGDTEEEANNLLKSFDTTLNFLANKCSRLTGLDQEDLKQEGIIGLARAKRDFEVLRSGKFKIFAIYKIKDAMREFITSQAANIRTPQYIKDANRLANTLIKTVAKAYQLDYASMIDVWEMSADYKTDPGFKDIAESVEQIRTSIENLASRSHTSVSQLLDRAEMMPLTQSVVVENVGRNKFTDLLVENNLIDHLSARESVAKIKELISNDEFNLLYARFVEGRTTRELEPELGVKAETIVVRTNNIIEKLNKHKDKILQNESNDNTTKVKSGQFS